jgi:hypothetical protein
MTVANSPLQTEGLGQLVTGNAIDNANNSATDAAALNIDQTSPTTVASVVPAPNAAGWNNTLVSRQCGAVRQTGVRTSVRGLVRRARPLRRALVPIWVAQSSRGEVWRKLSTVHCNRLKASAGTDGDA